ncbi:replicative DNA helicase [Thermus arciformis]|uniref:Replicative DNA helicase n=1 Tax=Thermus arciformis TaxID=482827 RepID=A0A1G7JN10_9DEIN|nr:replicative DNA helicase [Thermus arciformis]SDF26256.1 replicative DNA helicase [Thermus arciformis]
MEGRIPPHSLEAEQSVLGSILLDSDVMDELEGLLPSPEAFYLEAHRKIYAAMQGLRAGGKPVDLVTLAEELSRRGELEGVGGVSYLVQLSEATPTAAYAEHYARIVAEKWTLRRLIQAAGEAMRLAYEEAGSLDEILDQAGKRILEVALTQTETEARAMRELVHETFEHIEALFQNKGEVAGVRTGFKELDELIGTLAPGSLNIIAARPAMGKTAFALTIAQHAALKEGVGVGIYSLEMPAAQLTLRLMCSEARIDMNRVRLGQLSDRDFSRLVDVAGRLSEAPIFIDDTPDLTLMELRARARRLRSQHNVGLIIIDYLQLMSGPGGGRNGENRQQEIAAISRGLKALARELDLPVIALSQLSRAVEARPNKRPMLSDLRESGCLTGDTLVQLADGSRRYLRDLVGKSGFEVLALNEATQKLERARVSRAFSTGVKPVYRLTTRLGRSIRATANHKFLTPQGWKRLDELRLGDYLALPRQLPPSPWTKQTLKDEALALLGHLIGDGCTLPRHSLQYTTREPDLAQTVADLAQAVFGEAVSPRIKVERAWFEVYLTSARRPGWGNRNPVAAWLEELGVWGLRAQRMARALESEALERLADSDVYWDTVVSIEADGVEEVFDLTVPGLHNFIANNIIVHNSIEQDADLVMFIYRDEYYNPHSEKAGIAEIIVGKQRNGPTGTVELQFHAQHVRFNDLAKEP